MANFKGELLVSFGLQGIGAAAMLLATLLLGMVLGPEAQGDFSHVKAEIEFISTFAMFGLPQALFFYAKSGCLDSIAASRWILGCTVCALLLGAAYMVWSNQHGAIIIVLSCAAGAVVAHGILRTLLLVGSRTVWFNVITALPQVLVLIGAGVVFIYNGIGPAGWSALFAFAYFFVIILAGWRLYLNPIRSKNEPVKWRSLVYYGLAAWLAAVLATAATLFMQNWVEAIQGQIALGQFTMGMMLVQIPLTPINYAAPLLFRRWMDIPGRKAPYTIASIAFAGLLVVSMIVWGISKIQPDLWLGIAYTGVAHVLVILLTGGAAEAASRILLIQANARGYPWITTCAELFRWIILGGGWFFVSARSLESVCVIWAAGAWVVAGVYMVFVRVDKLDAAAS